MFEMSKKSWGQLGASRLARPKGLWEDNGLHGRLLFKLFTGVFTLSEELGLKFSTPTPDNSNTGSHSNKSHSLHHRSGFAKTV